MSIRSSKSKTLFPASNKPKTSRNTNKARSKTSSSKKERKVRTPQVPVENQDVEDDLVCFSEEIDDEEHTKLNFPTSNELVCCDDNLVNFDDESNYQHPTPVLGNQPQYDFETREKYCALRKACMDPITYVCLDPQTSFQYPYKWDPYTGEITGLDPDGPLCFDPDVLIKTFYTNRLNKLWGNPHADSSSSADGYYDDAVGIGPDFYVHGRGNYTEWYLFRLPIIDCYLPENYDKQLVTMGPKLTDADINEIARLSNLNPNRYVSLFPCKMKPDIVRMKQLYDTAVSNTVPCKVNRTAVDQLIKM